MQVKRLNRKCVTVFGPCQTENLQNGPETKFGTILVMPPRTLTFIASRTGSVSSVDPVCFKHVVFACFRYDTFCVFLLLMLLRPQYVRIYWALKCRSLCCSLLLAASRPIFYAALLKLLLDSWPKCFMLILFKILKLYWTFHWTWTYLICTAWSLDQPKQILSVLEEAAAATVPCLLNSVFGCIKSDLF